jgi:hypothetical protein
MRVPRRLASRSIAERAWALGLVAATVFAPSAALAGPAAPSKGAPAKERDPADVEYDRHMDNGVKLYQSGNFTGALIEFEAAYKAKPKASPLINEALCFREQHKYPEAVSALETALREHADSMDAKNKQAAEKAIAEMKELFAFLSIVVTPADAKVTVDGDDKTPSELGAIALGPDAHVVTVEAEGYKSHTEKVALAAGDKRTLTIALESTMGTLRIFARLPTSAIEIDGKVVAHGEWSGPVGQGGHSVRIVGESDTEPVDVAAGGIATIDKRKKPDAPAPPAPPPSKPKPAPRPPHGFYGLVTGALLFTPAAPCAFLGNPAKCSAVGTTDISRNAGGAAGLRGGYRVNTFAAFEGLFEYGNVSGGRADGAEGYSLTDLRLGPSLRLMSPGKLVHFVGTLGGGLALDFVKFKNTSGFTACTRNGASQCFESWGVDFFVASDVGLEFDIENVLLGASFNVTGNSLKGVDANPKSGVTGQLLNQFDQKAAFFFGPRVHFGYAFW